MSKKKRQKGTEDFNSTKADRLIAQVDNDLVGEVKNIQSDIGKTIGKLDDTLEMLRVR